jgi:FAD:protein FMN transferase
MKQSRDLMGMTITIEIIDSSAGREDIDEVFAYFMDVEERFSYFKNNSEVTLINEGKIVKSGWSKDIRTIVAIAEKTKKETNGFFDITLPDGKFNPSGLVKGWAIYNAAEILLKKGFRNFYVDAGGDIQLYGLNAKGRLWKVGVKNPFEQTQIVKVVNLKDQGIATSGTYIRGQHIYNPFNRSEALTDIVSLSVIGPDVLEADRFATAAFAMGKKGISFIENLNGFEGYMIDKNGIGTETSGFKNYSIFNNED